jgi:hypothetical protein
MERQRERLALEKGETQNWLDLDAAAIKEVAEWAVEEVAVTSKCTKYRLEHPKTSNAFERRAEQKFLLELLKFWFTRKWQETHRQSHGPTRIRTQKVCKKCEGLLRCVSCDKESIKVI